MSCKWIGAEREIGVEMMTMPVVFYQDSLLIPCLRFSPDKNALSRVLAAHLFYSLQLTKMLLIVLWWTRQLNRLHFHLLYQFLQLQSVSGVSNVLRKIPSERTFVI